MKKMTKNPRSLILAIVFFFAILSMIFFLWLINVIGSQNPNQLPPLMAVEGIAVGDNKVFALDNMYDRIYVFSEQGSFLFYLNLPKWGIKYIHYQGTNIVVYCSAKDRDELFFYDGDSGDLDFVQVLNSRNDVDWNESIIPKTTVDYEGKTFSFIDRDFLPSIVRVSGSETRSFSVEPFWMHALWNVFILIIFGCFVGAFISIGRFYFCPKKACRSVEKFEL